MGKGLRTEHLHAQAAPSPLPYCRVAVVVGKHGHTVVERNRLRRRLRELARLSLIPDCANVDVVLRALPNAYRAEFTGLRGEVNEIKAQIVNSNST